LGRVDSHALPKHVANLIEFLNKTLARCDPCSQERAEPETCMSLFIHAGFLWVRLLSLFHIILPLLLLAVLRLPPDLYSET